MDFLKGKINSRNAMPCMFNFRVKMWNSVHFVEQALVRMLPQMLQSEPLQVSVQSLPALHMHIIFPSNFILMNPFYTHQFITTLPWVALKPYIA